MFEMSCKSQQIVLVSNSIENPIVCGFISLTISCLVEQYIQRKEIPENPCSSEKKNDASGKGGEMMQLISE